MTEGMSIDKGELSVERECDVSVLIKQICTESDVMSPSVFYVSPACGVCWNAALD